MAKLEAEPVAASRTPEKRKPKTNMANSSPNQLDDDDMDDNENSEFEYHIEFPTPREKNIVGGNGIVGEERIWDSSDSEVTSSEEADKDIVVILIGWAGSKDKYLAKYSDIYLKRGCIVLRYIAPIKMLFIETSKLPVMAEKLLCLLKDMQLDSHPIFFHVFSNGGAFTYSYILREMSLRPELGQLDIRGTIFDSAPTPRNLWIVFKALVNIFGDYNWVRYFMAAGIILILIFHVFWYHMKTAFHFCWLGDNITPVESGGFIRRDDEAPSQNWLSRISQIRNHNFLFIYSEVDELIHAHKVEHVAEILSNRENRIKYLKFTDSEHVKHYKKYPKEYVEAVSQFIQTVMRDGSNKSIFGKDD